jgi:hypothetical protein
VTGYHKDGSIGVITRVLKQKIEVKFSSTRIYKFNPEQIEIVDVSACETIPFLEMKKSSVTGKAPEINGVVHNKVILGNEVSEFVGIGWVLYTYVTKESLSIYARVVDDEEHKKLMLYRKFGV